MIFWQKRSTETNLFEFLEDWTLSIDFREPVDVIYIDLEKAFHKVVHSKLLHGLKRLGIGRNVPVWMENFLTGRTQWDRIISCASQEDLVVTVIPQEVIMCPLFFHLYVDDMLNLDENRLKLFADDSKPYGKFSTQQLRASIERDLLIIVMFLDQWHLKIISSMSEIFYHGRNNKQNEYYISGVQIPESTTWKDVGVVLLNAYLWENTVVASWEQHMFGLSTCKSHLSTETRIFSDVFMRPMWKRYSNMLLLSGLRSWRRIQIYQRMYKSASRKYFSDSEIIHTVGGWRDLKVKRWKREDCKVTWSSRIRWLKSVWHKL